MFRHQTVTQVQRDISISNALLYPSTSTQNRQLPLIPQHTTLSISEPPIIFNIQITAEQDTTNYMRIYRLIMDT